MEVEILQTVRSQGMDSMEDVKAVVLETDGSMPIKKKEPFSQSQELIFTQRPHHKILGFTGFS